MPGPDALLAAALVRNPASPLLTFYDDASGDRTELSATTLANWVAKTANLLRDDVGVVDGDRVAVLLPAHWQTASVLLGAWSAGAAVTTDPSGAAAAFVDADHADLALAAGAQEVFALALAPLGRGFTGAPPDRTRDYVQEARGHGDRYSAVPVGDNQPALVVEGSVITAGDLVEVTLRRADELGLLPGDRLLTAAPWDGPVDWVDGLLAPLAAGASVVLCAHADLAALARRADTERVTATLGVTLPGIRVTAG